MAQRAEKELTMARQPDPGIPHQMQVLTVPGLHGSGPQHWQSRWEQRFSDWQRVSQTDWARPSLHLWAEKVGQHVASARRVAPGGAILVAHSFGCLASIHHAQQEPEGIAGMLLVAPADPDKFGVAQLLPTHRLPFPTLLVASRDDPWMAQRTAFSWGTVWGSELVDAGSLGHINADSGLGDWPEGLRLLGRLAQRIAPKPLAHDSREADVWEIGLNGVPVPYI
jgi:predicted alpha/beta hydrolase family esterase